MGSPDSKIIRQGSTKSCFSSPALGKLLFSFLSGYSRCIGFFQYKPFKKILVYLHTLDIRNSVAVQEQWPHLLLDDVKGLGLELADAVVVLDGLRRALLHHPLEVLLVLVQPHPGRNLPPDCLQTLHAQCYWDYLNLSQENQGYPLNKLTITTMTPKLRHHSLRKT